MVGAALMGVGLAAAPSTAHAQAAPIVVVPCSVPELIAAIQGANMVSATLQLAPYCTYVLTDPAETGTRGPDGLPIITGNITLSGNHTTIKRGVAPKFRILETAGGSVLNLRGITIANGDAGINTGGGILSAHGTLVLTDSAVRQNTADNGAGISNDRGGVTLVYSVVSSNNTGGGGGGGGIYNDGNLALYNSRIGANRANTSGGGVYNEQGGAVKIVNSVVTSNNAADDGGAYYNNTGSSLSLQGSVVSRNTVGDSGAGGYNLGTLRVLQSAVRTNYAVVTGGGIYNGGDGTTLLYRSRVHHNQAHDGAGVFNSGLAGSVNLQSSAVDSNGSHNCVPQRTIAGCLG